MSMMRGAPAGLDANGRPVGRKPDTDLGPTADVVDTAGSGPVEVRKATPDELAARRVPNPNSPWRSQNAASYAAYQRSLAATAPAPATATESPAAIPCGTCGHAVVCRLRERVEGASAGTRQDLGGGLWLVATGVRIECEHHAPVQPEAVVTPRAAMFRLTRDEAAVSSKRGAEATAAKAKAKRERPTPPPAAPIRPRVGRHGMKAQDAEVIAALRAHAGNFGHAALSLGMTPEGVRLRARAMAGRDALPLDVLDMMTSRRRGAA